MAWPKGKKRPRKPKLLDVRPEAKEQLNKDWTEAVQNNAVIPKQEPAFARRRQILHLKDAQR